LEGPEDETLLAPLLPDGAAPVPDAVTEDDDDDADDCPAASLRWPSSGFDPRANISLPSIGLDFDEPARGFPGLPSFGIFFFFSFLSFLRVFTVHFS
jgi:hypothetical protein